MRWIVLHLNPEPWAVGPVQVGRSAGKMHGTIGRNAQLAAFQEAVREELGEQPLLEGKVALELYFWRRRDAYKTDNEKMHRKHEADLTNLQKATEDALQGVLFANDRDVAAVRAVMVEQGPEVESKIVIGIEEISAELHDSVATLPEEVFYLLDTEQNQPTFNFGEPEGERYDGSTEESLF